MNVIEQSTVPYGRAVVVDTARRVGRRRRALNAGWHSVSKKGFGRYEISNSRELDEEMFDIVNREYEENGSFRCDFFRNERT